MDAAVRRTTLVVLGFAAVLAAFGCVDGGEGARQAVAVAMSSLPTSRPFHLGFTPQPYDYSDEAFEKTYDLIGPHADIVAHHLDEGVPWPEVMAGQPFHANAEKDIARRLAHRKPGQKVFLALSPLYTDRASLAGYWGEDSHAERPGVWKDRGFGDPEVIEAYTRYCLEMIRRFDPDYLAYAIEVSDVVEHAADAYPAFREMLGQVYRRLKRAKPDLPIFVTFVLGDAGYMERRAPVMRDLLAASDYFAVSTYPYVYDGIGGDGNRLPADWFTKIRKYSGGKPFAVAETGFIAQTFAILRHLVLIPGNAAGQAAYLERLLADAHRLDARFVIWFCPVDYDALWDKMSAAGANPWFKQWRDTGLLDERFERRPALDLWDAWLALPRR